MQEKRVDNILKKLVAANSISEETWKSLKPVRTRPGIMYGLCKVRKDIIDNCAPFLPALSAINTPKGKLYKQGDGVTTGSSLGPTLANAFLVHFERNWLQNCPPDIKTYYYRRYVDDIFVLFTSPQHLEAFRNLLNG